MVGQTSEITYLGSVGSGHKRTIPIAEVCSDNSATETMPRVDLPQSLRNINHMYFSMSAFFPLISRDLTKKSFRSPETSEEPGKAGFMEILPTLSANEELSSKNPNQMPPQFQEVHVNMASLGPLPNWGKRIPKINVRWYIGSSWGGILMMYS